MTGRLQNISLLPYINIPACQKSTLFGTVWPRLAPGPVRPILALFGPVWPRLAPFGPVWPCLALFGPVWPRLARLSKRKGLEGTPKEYHLGIDRRLKKGLRAKLGLHPYQEGQCYWGIFHASKIEAFMESVTKVLDFPVLTN